MIEKFLRYALRGFKPYKAKRTKLKEKIVLYVVENKEIPLSEIRGRLKKSYSDTSISRAVEELRKEKVIKSFKRNKKPFLKPYKENGYSDIYFRHYNNKQLT